MTIKSSGRIPMSLRKLKNTLNRLTKFNRRRPRSHTARHFVVDYERHVAHLKRTHPIDEAMSLAVGGKWVENGELLSKVALYAGVEDGMSVLDFGCGSGRFASALSQKVELSNFLGIDVVQDLLDYAASKSPSHFTFQRHLELSIPARDDTFDHAYAFSVFTHLLQAESFIYLEEIHRVLKPGGKLALTFFELTNDRHWGSFVNTVEATRKETLPHLNAFIELSQIEVWCKRVGFLVADYVDGASARWDGKQLVQSLVILQKPDQAE